MLRLSGIGVIWASDVRSDENVGSSRSVGGMEEL